RAVVAHLAELHLEDAVAAARRELAPRRARAVRPVVLAVVALLSVGGLHDPVAAPGRALAGRRARALGAVVHAVVALLAVLGLDQHVAAVRGQHAPGRAPAHLHQAVGALVHAVVALLRPVHDRVPAARAPGAVRLALAVPDAVVRAVVALLRRR